MGAMPDEQLKAVSEELTSLVDGHIDLRESLAQAGRVPPIDPYSTEGRTLTAKELRGAVELRGRSSRSLAPSPIAT